MSPKVVDKKERRARILQAALQVFGKKGFAKATITDIAAAAGIGKGTVYEYFATKDEIIHDSFLFFIHSLEMDFQEVLVQKIPALEKMRQILSGFSQFITGDNEGVVDVMFEFWAEAIKDKKAKGHVFKEMNDFYRSYREVFADIIIEGMADGSFRKNINPNTVAAMIIGTLDGIMVQWILDKEAVDFSDVVNTLMIALFYGLTAEKDQDAK